MRFLPPGIHTHLALKVMPTGGGSVLQEGVEGMIMDGDNCLGQ